VCLADLNLSGNVRTGLQKQMQGMQAWIIDKILYPGQKGALTPLYVGTSPEVVNVNGGYFIPWARRGIMANATKDPRAGDRLWNWIEEQRKEYT